MLPYPLTNFEIQIHYKKETKFKTVYLWNKLPAIKDGALEILTSPDK